MIGVECCVGDVAVIGWDERDWRRWRVFTRSAILMSELSNESFVSCELDDISEL